MKSTMFVLAIVHKYGDCCPIFPYCLDFDVALVLNTTNVKEKKDEVWLLTELLLH